jgi:hypothetical protein
MDWFYCNSSNVNRFKFEEGILIVQFNSGAVYEYYGVDEGTVEDFKRAGSKGKFVWNRLRDQYDYRRIA